MNSPLINIRFLRWHLKINERFIPRIVENRYHIGRRPWFKVYQFGEHFYD